MASKKAVGYPRYFDECNTWYDRWTYRERFAPEFLIAILALLFIDLFRVSKYVRQGGKE